MHELQLIKYTLTSILTIVLVLKYQQAIDDVYGIGGNRGKVANTANSGSFVCPLPIVFVTDIPYLIGFKY